MTYTVDKKVSKLLTYGVPLDLAQKAVAANLSVSLIRSTPQKTLVANFGMSKAEAKILADSIKREPIDDDVARTLLSRSNFTCCACKGTPQFSGYLIHHIVSYEVSQDNGYENLVVLCPNHHDQAHRDGNGLSLKLTADDLRKCKVDWEKLVEVANVEKAAQSINVNDEAVDYVNASRIEEACLKLFGEVPDTSHTSRLKSQKILDGTGSFDQRYVSAKLSGGRYLFDFMNKGQTSHYKELMELIARKVTFVNLGSTSSFAKLRNMEGKYAYFIGGVVGKRPELPITNSTPPVVLKYRRRKVRMEWHLDPQFLMSMSAISRMGVTHRYIVYCRVGSVRKNAEGIIEIVASPLFIAFPNHSVHRRPIIAYEQDFERYLEAGLIDDGEE